MKIIQDPNVDPSTQYAPTAKGADGTLTLRRNSGWSGSTGEIDALDPGIPNYYVNVNFQAKTITAANNPGFTWGIQSILMSNNVVQPGHNQGDYQNVAINATVIKASNTPTWGLNSNTVERTGTRTGMGAGVGGAVIGNETSIAITGTDSVHQTVGQNLIAGNATPTSGERASLWVASWAVGSQDGYGNSTYDVKSSNWQNGYIAQGCTEVGFLAIVAAGARGFRAAGAFTDADFSAGSTNANFILQATPGSSYNLGIDLSQTHLSTGVALRLAASQEIEWLGACKIMYDLVSNQLRFYGPNGTVVGHLDMGGADHAM